MRGTGIQSNHHRPHVNSPRSRSGSPPPDDAARDSPAPRQLCLRLVREVLRRLGWRYKLYVPALIALSAIFLLPPRFLQFFTAGSESLASVSGERFVFLLAVFGGSVAVCLWLAVFLSGLAGEWLRLKVSIGLRRDAVRALHRTRIEALDTAHRGDWMTRVTSDLRNCEGFLTDSIPRQIQSLTLAAGAAVLFFLHSGAIALIPCAAALLLAWFNARVQRRMAPVLTESRELEGQIFQSLMESYEGLRTVRSAGGEAGTMERINRQFRALQAAGMRIIRSMAALMGLNEFSSQIVITLCLTVVALALREGELTVEAVLVFPFFINVFLHNVRDLAAAAYDWNRFFIEGGRLAAVLYDEGTKRPEDSQVFGGLVAGAPCRRISVEGLEVGYGGEAGLLGGMEFSVERGEVVAVMGPSGSGKSTFLECLAGLRAPRTGRFTVETGDGEAREFPEAPRFLAAFVEQRPYLFVGTIRENLLLGRERAEIDDETIWNCLAKLDMAETVRERGGLEAELTDRGLNMSEGQRYRLTLARALLADRPFLMLDEPFAALDEESMRGVVRAIEAAREGGAGVVIATHVLPPELKPGRVVQLRGA